MIEDREMKAGKRPCQIRALPMVHRQHPRPKMLNSKQLSVLLINKGKVSPTRESSASIASATTTSTNSSPRNPCSINALPRHPARRKPALKEDKKKDHAFPLLEIEIPVLEDYIS